MVSKMYPLNGTGEQLTPSSGSLYFPKLGAVNADCSINREFQPNILVKHLVALVALAIFALNSFGDPLANWTRLTPAPIGKDLASVSSGDGRFIAVGSDAVATSPDGLDWDWQEVRGLHRGVAYGNGVFVIGGRSGVLTSEDGINWVQSASTEGMFACAFGAGRFVVVGDFILTSEDGLNWEEQSAPGQLWAVIHDGANFVAVGDGGRILRSSDGRDWESVGPGGYVSLRGVAYGNGRHVVTGILDHANPSIGVVFSSVDGGLTWQQLGSAQQGRDFPTTSVTYGQGIFVATRHDAVLTSNDGDNWVNRGSATSTRHTTVHYGQGDFVLVGAEGQVGVSPDGVEWTEIHNPPAPALLAAAFGNGRWVAVGESGLIVGGAADDTVWTPIVSGVTSDLRAVTFGAGQFVIVGMDGVVLRSLDGLQWEPSTSGTAAALSDIHFHEGMFAAVGTDGAVLTSQDGIDWEPQNSGTPESLSGITVGKGLWVAVGSKGTVITSPNTVEWSPADFPIAAGLNSITYGAGRFVAAGKYSRTSVIESSEDLRSWTSAISEKTNWWRVTTASDVAYHNGRFVAAVTHYDTNGLLLTSTDGLRWTEKDTGIAASLLGLGFGANRLVAVGSFGQAALSEVVYPRIALRLDNSGSVTLQISGHIGANYEIQASSNLLSWRTVESGVQATSDLTWIEEAERARQFYRVKLK